MGETYPEAASSLTMEAAGAANIRSACRCSQYVSSAANTVTVAPAAAAAPAPPPPALTNTRADIACHTDSVHDEYTPDFRS